MANRPVSGYIAYRTVQGDTFDIISLMQYNTEKYASAVIEANPDYSDVLIFGAGVELQIPVFSNAEIPATLPPWRRSE